VTTSDRALAKVDETMPLLLSKIESMAPDQGSIDAARKLLKPAGWPALATDEAGLVWGECQGSGSSPYRVVVSEEDAGYKCTCPSRKFPCKHALALMWMRAEEKVAFARADAPDWVRDWLGRRRGPVAAPAAEGGDARPKASIAASAPPEPDEAQPDPKAEARAAAQRERLKREREEAILRGLDELDLWLSDQLQAGLSSFPAVAREKCRIVAQRLVDAKAGALAARVETLAADLFAQPDAERDGFLLSSFAQLHLIAEAYRRQEALPAALRADVRQAVGWTVTREALIADPAAPRAEGRWIVLATLQFVQPDRLRRIETWLGRADDGDGPRSALLLDFVPVSAGAAGRSYAAGETFEAELVFYPSAAPLRAVIGAQRGPPTREPASWSPETPDVAAAVAAYERLLARRPWLEVAPFSTGAGRVRSAGDALYLCDPDGGAAVPLKAGAQERPLTGTTIDKAFGLFDGRALSLRYAETPIGAWVAA